MKAPKFPSYDEVMKQKKKSKNELKLSKAEWKKLEEKSKKKEREKHQRVDKNRKRGITIAYRVSEDEKNRIYKRIKMSGFTIGDFMRDSILNTSLEIVVTKKVSDAIRESLSELIDEVKLANQKNLLEDDLLNKLKDIIFYFQNVEVRDE